MQIAQLETSEELERAYRVMNELRDHLDLDAYFALLEPMIRDGYEMWALSVEDDIKALAGVAVRTNFYYGRYIWVYDLITKEDERSRGYGEALLGRIEELGRERNCDLIALSSGMQRLDAHRFYEERMSFDRVSYDFTKSLRS